MRIIILATLLLATPAVAQKADRYPDPDLDGPRVVRTIPIVRNGFDDRWFGPAQADRWISNQPPPSDRFTPDATSARAAEQIAPTGLSAATGIVPVPGNRLRHDPIRTQAALPKAKTLGEDTRPAQVLCIKNQMRTVWYGSSWRCRK
jgi:hypothetical protein